MLTNIKKIILFMHKGVDYMYCPNCGCQCNDDCFFCPSCGAKLKSDNNNNSYANNVSEYSDKSKIAAGILQIFYHLE